MKPQRPTMSEIMNNRQFQITGTTSCLGIRPKTRALLSILQTIRDTGLRDYSNMSRVP